jgi:hypothetical protein
LKYLQELQNIEFSFNNTRFSFNDNSKISFENKDYYYTDLFYNNIKLISIVSSFKNISGEGALRNLFGGYRGTIDDKNHFPQNLVSIRDSFIISYHSGAESVKLYLGDSFLQKIKNTITHISGANDNETTSSSSFSGSALTKYIDVEDNEGIVLFPYKIFSGCSKLKEVPALFRGLSRLSTQETDDVITLPTYQDEYGNIKSMFDDTINIKNISYLFSNMKGIKYTLTGHGFKKCSLINVHGIFAESSNNNLTGGNKEGSIPYGLFLQEQKASYAIVDGLTEEDAERLHIEDEKYGIENCVFDSDGKVIVEFDDDGKIISGKTYPDGYYIKYKINDKGFIMDGEQVPDKDKEPATENEIYPKPTASTTHSGSYTKPNPTIQDMGSLFEYSSSTLIRPYYYDIEKENISVDASTGKYKCPDLVIDNENYNPIKYFINKDFDPLIFIWNEDMKTYVKNDKYDPRRVILNKNYDKYKKKWNKWVSDGTSELATKIKDSELYKSVQDGVNKELPATLPEELTEGYIPGNIPISEDIINNSTNERFETRSYIFAPDIFRYCKNDENTNVKKAFYCCSGPDTSRENIDDDTYIGYGLYGVLPPYLFEPISKVNDLSEIFYYCKGILPYRWRDKDGNYGLMYHPDMFSKMNRLKKLNGTFAYNIMYDNCKIQNTQFSKNNELRELNRMFYNTIWDSDKGFAHIDDDLFSNNKLITDVSYMFCSSDNHGNNRAPKIISSKLFTNTNHTYIENCSYFMYNSQYTSGSVPEFWKWNTSKMKTITGCYRNVNGTNISNYKDIPDSYK